MLKLNKKGFTLIELLVVIAIIGILASIVLVSLNDARNKGYDTEIKSEIAQIRNALEMCYDENGGDYDGCTAPASLTAPACSPGGYTVVAAGQTYDISADLCSNAALKWCSNETGVTVAAAACP